MNNVNINKIIDGLRKIDDRNFTCNNISKFLAENPIKIDSIEKYFFWSKKFYTRNLIYKDERFEAIVLCWEKEQFSPVHDHSSQKCWMTVPIGKLHGQNFEIVEFNEERNLCKLRETTFFDLYGGFVSSVDLEEPIHQISNLPEFNERAVSVHIYSKPIDTCLAYCLDSHTFKKVNLRYTSIDGKLSKDIVL